MTVAALPSTASYIEDGVTTSFPVPFRFKAAGDLVVDRIAGGNATRLVLGSDYSVTGGATDAGGTLTRASASAGATLRIARRTPRSQPMVYTNGDRFPAKSHEEALDRAILIVQELDASLDDTRSRALRLPVGEAVASLPPPPGRAGRVLMFDGAGNVLLKPEAFFAPGAAGPSNNTRRDLAALKAAPVTDLTSLYDGSLWMWAEGDFTGQADDVTIVLADGVAPSIGAWVRSGEGQSKAQIRASRHFIGRIASLGFIPGAVGLVIPTPALDGLNEAIDFDDELNQRVSLAEGGSAMMRFQPESMVPFLRVQLARNASGAKFAYSRALIGGERLKANIFADSKGYGQIGPLLPPSEWTPTGFDDLDPNFPIDGQPGESKHQFARINAPWPVRTQFYLRQKLGAMVDVVNRSLSGDRLPTIYRRQKNAPFAHFDIYAGGINDVFFATGVSAGGLPNIFGDGPWSIRNSAYALLMNLSRSILRGSVPLFVAPASVKPSSPDLVAVNLALREYKAAWRAVCDLLGVRYMDEEWSVGRSARDFVTSDGTHWNDIGADILGAAVACAILCLALDAPVIHGPTTIGANISSYAVGGLVGGGGGNLTSITDTNALSRPISSATGSETLVLTEGADVFFPVWLASDMELQAMPLGWTQTNASAFHTFTVINDFGTGSTFRAQPGVEYATKGSRGPQPPIARNFSDDGAVERTFHHEVQAGGLPLLQGEGPHIIGVNVPFATPVGAGGPVLHLDGVKLVAPEEWVPLPIAAGFAQFGDIEPAARFMNGRAEFRGLIAKTSAIASAGGVPFLWPSFTGIALLPTLRDATFSQNDVVLAAYSGVWEWRPSVSFTADIAGSTMTVSAMAAGSNPLRVGSYINGAGVTDLTTIVAFGTGMGGVGTYTVSTSQTVASVAMTAAFRNIINLAELTQAAAGTAGN